MLQRVNPREGSVYGQYEPGGLQPSKTSGKWAIFERKDGFLGQKWGKKRGLQLLIGNGVENVSY
jgi:hypothetical protein